MSEPEDPAVGTNHPFNVYKMVDSLTKEQWVGGSYDNISATSIACAAFTAWVSYSPGGGILIGVFDSADTPIAFIGRVE